MDLKKLDKALDAIVNMDSERFEELSEAMQLTLMRGEAKADDTRALEEIGLERITVFLESGSYALLVKPNQMLGEAWLLNLYGSGSINIKCAEPSFKVMNIGLGSAYRLFVTTDGMEYWVDLIDLQQAIDLVEFLGITIEES